MKNNAFGALALLILATITFACGSSSGGGSGGSSGTGSGGSSGTGGGTGTGGRSGTGGAGVGGGSALQQACRTFCMSEEVHNCHTNASTTVDICMSYRCPPAGEQGSRESPASCATAYVNYYKCLTAQQTAGTANPEEPTKPGCQEPGSCTAEADAFATANCP